MRTALATLVALACTLPAAAHADTVDQFTLTAGANVYAWTLPSVVSFTYPDNIPQFLPTFPTTLITNGVSSTTTVTFEYNHAANLIVGGLWVYDGPSFLNTTGLGDDGTFSSYTGTFDLGTYYAGYVYGLSGNNLIEIPATLTIAQQETAPTPEPSSLLLLVTASIASLATLKRRVARYPTSRF